MLLAHGALLQCSSLVVSLGGAVAEGNKEEGMELVRIKYIFLYGLLFLRLLFLVLVVVLCSVFKISEQIMCTTVHHCVCSRKT